MEIKFSPGNPEAPFGYTQLGADSHFSLYSETAAAVFLGLFYPGKTAPEKTYLLEKSGSTWHGKIEGLPAGMGYAFQIKSGEGEGDWVSDPWTKIPLSRPLWGEKSSVPSFLSLAAPPPPFDWEGVSKPNLPFSSLILYEMHVRGFTQHKSSKVGHPGTYLGMIEKIPYLQSLGVNAVELMPIFEFDELYPEKKGPLLNYWGYSPLFYFAPMRRYAESKEPFGPVQEFKTLVKALHRAGIEVILDVVYNHTGECQAHPIHMWKIDKKTYYRHDSEGKLVDYTGCGNTLNTSHPVVEKLVLESLRYWVEEMQVDGFRFDLASVLTRGPLGEPLAPSPLIQAIGQDPLLSRCKLIAEPWDPAGLYQVGLFPEWGPWSEWNDKFRDVARQFIKGTEGKAGLFSSILSGSEFVYATSKTPFSSINFITAHDGFTLRDLVSYQTKRNEANGEENRDGNNHNESWNCGAEGDTENPKVLKLRAQQMRNFFLSLFVSQGIPMLLMGDEYGHTRQGNNNAYVQDNEKSWFLWDSAPDMVHFVQGLISLKKNHPALGMERFLTQNDVDWHGQELDKPDWSPKSRLVAFTLKKSPSLFIAFNASSHPTSVQLPKEKKWKLLVYTENDWNHHWLGKEQEAPLIAEKYMLSAHSALLATELVNF